MKECIECGILIEDADKFCRVCGAFQRPRDMGRDGRRSTKPYQTIPVEAPAGEREVMLGDRQRRQLNRLCLLGIIISMAGIFMAAFKMWYGVIYGVISMIFGALAVHYKVEFGESALIMGTLCTILASSLPFALSV